MNSETNSNSRGGLLGEALPHAWPEPSRPTRPAPAENTVHSYRRAHRRRGDRLIAAGIAAGVHLVVIFGIKSSPAPDVKPGVAADEPVVLEMPELEPPEAIDVVEVTDAVAPPEMAPPMMLDLPSTVPVSNFLQPMQPQLDPALTSVSSLKIPAMTGNFGQPGSPGVKLFDLSELDRVPRRLRTVMPVYPFDLRRAGIMGEVVLLVIIDPSGHVEVERVLSATNADFAAAASKAAEQCVFESPRKGGQKVSARYTWRIPFELN